MESGCKNEMKYVLFDDTEELQGYVIFANNKSGHRGNISYFDLGQNKAFEIPSTNFRMTNGWPTSYRFYKDGDKNMMVNYTEKNHAPCLQFIELKFLSHFEQELLCEKEVEGIAIGRIEDRYIYLHQTHELYYKSLYGRYEHNGLLVNIDTFEMRKLFSDDAYTPHPVDFFGDKYLALGPSGIFFYDEDKIENVFDHDDPFIQGVLPEYSAVLKKVLYRKKQNGITTIAIFDLGNMQVINTGIIPEKFNSSDTDKMKFHFFGERYILYAMYKKNIFFSKFLNSTKYVIYDYVNQKEIGYVKNCQISSVYDFFP
jgi:hypothetical protein